MTDSQTHKCYVVRWFPFALASLLAFALRVATADGDLWGDEAASVTLSLRPIGLMLATLASAEPHPPLYPLVLKAWMRLAGTEELVARLPSIAAGTLTVPLLGQLGRIVDPAVGVVAALLAAVSPFLIWYASEARMYPFVTLFAVATWFALLRLLSSPSRAASVGYAAATTLGLLSHYFFLFVGAAQAAVALGWLARDRRLLGPLAGAAALALLLPTVWLIYAGRIVGSYYGAQPGSVDFGGILLSFASRLGPGWSVDRPTADALALALAPPLLAGAALAWRRPVGRVWLLWLLLPLLLAALVSMHRPMFQERYFVVVAPAAILLLATTIAAARRAVLRLLLGVGTTILLSAPLLTGAAFEHVRSQYGRHAALTNRLGRPGDAVILTGTSQSPLYEYYASRDGAGLPVFGVPRNPPASAPEAIDELTRVVAGYDALWLFLYAVDDYDPTRLVERWLSEHAYRAPPDWTVNGRLIRFATERGARLGELGRLRELGSEWRVAPSLPAAAVAAGALLPARLDLIPARSPSPAPKLRLRLLDARGFIWGESDEPLGAGLPGLPDLALGEALTERRAIAVYTGAPGGQYRVEAQLYLEEPGGTRPLGMADLGSVAVAPSDRFWPADIAGFVRLDGTAPEGWQLLGAAASDRARAGDRAYVTTVWRAGGAATEQRLRLRAPDGRTVSTRFAALAGPPGSVLRVQLAPPIGASWAPGLYRLELALDGGWRQVGALRVEPGPPPPRASEPARPLDVVIGGVARLRGYTPAPTGPTLHWESIAEVDRSLHVFVHALRSDGSIAAQSDGPPAGGRSPTHSRSGGDPVDVPQPLDAAPGEYRVVVGLYDPPTGARLPLPTGADHVDLGGMALGR
jgi:mannosyltransferase